MNERIKQLAEQAGYYLYDLTETHECKTVETDSTDEWITLEKFVELIVLKCAKIADTAEPFLASDLIKEHFGVKE